MRPRTLTARLEALEAGKQRHQGPPVAFYDPEIPGDALAAVQRYFWEHGRRPAALLPDNRRGDR